MQAEPSPLYPVWPFVLALSPGHIPRSGIAGSGVAPWWKLHIYDVCVAHTCHDTCIEVRGQLVGLGSLLSACRMELIIGLGGKHLLTDPSYWPQLMAKACSSV